jgi:ribosomal protein S18 acetylase RimI-like enzyme
MRNGRLFLYHLVVSPISSPYSLLSVLFSLQMDILPTSLRDLGQLRHIEQACFPKDAWPLLDLIAVLTWPDVIRLKAVVDGRMVGFIAGDPRRTEGMAWIATLGVLPEYRRQGIARALLLECEKRLSASRLRLCVRLDNTGAIRLYEQEGYQRVGIWTKYYNDSGDALVMEKIQ